MPLTSPGLAASTVLAPLIDGPVTRATVVCSLPSATYCQVAGRVLAVLGSGSPLLPLGLLHPAGAGLLWDSRGTLDIQVGAGAVVIGDSAARVHRWWSPDIRGQVRPRQDRFALAAQWPAAYDMLLASVPDARLAVDALQADDPGECVSRLVGRGPGFTPSGDDVLAGWLVAANVMPELANRLSAVTRHLESAADRTTLISYALLREAATGQSLPPLTALLRAWSTGTAPDAALGELAAVGHSSGMSMALGTLHAIRSQHVLVRS